MADVDPSAVIGTGVKMEESTVIEGGAQIGNDCVLGKRVVIEKHAVIGSNFTGTTNCKYQIISANPNYNCNAKIKI